MPYRAPKDPWAAEALRRFGAWFERQRLNAGISQRSLSRRSGVDQAAISRFEHGDASGLRAEAIARMARALEEYRPFGP